MLRDIQTADLANEEDEVIFDRAQTMVNETREEVYGIKKMTQRNSKGKQANVVKTSQKINKFGKNNNMSLSSNSQKNKGRVGGMKPKNKTARTGDSSASGQNNKKANHPQRFGANTAIHSPGVTSPSNRL